MSNNLITNLDTCIPSALSMLGGNFNLLYYSHFPTIILSLLFGFFVLIKGEGKLLSKIFFLLSMAFVTWSVLDLFTWLSSDTRIIMFTWSIIGIIEALFFMLSLYFVYVFIEKRDMDFKYKIMGTILILPLIVMIPTRLNLSAFNATDCYSLENNFSLNYKYFLEIISSIVILIFSFIKLRTVDKDFRKQLKLLFMGIVLFLSSFFVAIFLSGYLVDNGMIDGYGLEIYGLFGTIIFMGFLAYLIVKFKAFNIKLIGAQALVAALVILIASQYAFIQNPTNRILTGITLVLAVGFGWFLIKSVKLEVQRKEELQLMSDKLAVANDQLRKLDNAKSEFISIASHQLRTPPTAIRGYASLLLEGSYGPITKEQQDAISKIYKANDQQVRFVEDLLNVSRIESGRMTYTFEKFRIEDLCQDAVNNLTFKAKEKELYLDYKNPEQPLPELTIDGPKVREVISNLVDNAVKYSLKGGVAVRIDQVLSADSKIGADSIRVTVSDTGIGIPDTELPYLFAKFSRGKDISRLNTGGTGLGLYVAKNMIEANGGKIWAESDGEGKGSRFILELPVEQSQEVIDKYSQS